MYHVMNIYRMNYHYFPKKYFPFHILFSKYILNKCKQSFSDKYSKLYFVLFFVEMEMTLREVEVNINLNTT